MDYAHIFHQATRKNWLFHLRADCRMWKTKESVYKIIKLFLYVILIFIAYTKHSIYLSTFYIYSHSVVLPKIMPEKLKKSSLIFSSHMHTTKRQRKQQAYCRACNFSIFHFLNICTTRRRRYKCQTINVRCLFASVFD